MHLPTSYAMERIATWRSYFEKSRAPQEAAREEVGYDAPESQACRKQTPRVMPPF